MDFGKVVDLSCSFCILSLEGKMPGDAYKDKIYKEKKEQVVKLLKTTSCSMKIIARRVGLSPDKVSLINKDEGIRPLQKGGHFQSFWEEY